MRGVQLLQVHSKNLMAEAPWYESVREWRWPEGRPCPLCDAKRVMKRGVEENEPARQRYEGHVCGQRVDDLTGTICAGHHQPLKVWRWCLYCLGLKWSTEPMAQELDLDHSDVHQMTPERREGLVKTSLT
jgi:transposase-like protein